MSMLESSLFSSSDFGDIVLNIESDCGWRMEIWSSVDLNWSKIKLLFPTYAFKPSMHVSSL